MKMRMVAILKTLGAMGLVLALVGCASKQVGVAETKSVREISTTKTSSLETFTTKGKPTKPIWTPWGERQVYDPVQDIDVLRSLEDFLVDETLSEPLRGTIIGEADYINNKSLIDLGCKSYLTFSCEMNIVKLITKRDITDASKYITELAALRFNLDNTSKQHNKTFGNVMMCEVRGKNYPDIKRADIRKYKMSTREVAEHLFFNTCLTWSKPDGMKMRMVAILKTLGAMGLVLALAGCASDGVEGLNAPEKQTNTAQTIDVRIPSLESFTTKGKPTKVIKTPWGPREIYDPAQDPEVRAIFDVVYDRGDITFGDVSRYNSYFRTGPEGVGNDSILETEIIRRAREVQYNDMMRLGCRYIKTKPFLSYGRSYLKTSCGDSRFGELKLSECEKENLETFTEMNGRTLIIKDKILKTRHRTFREVTYPEWKRKAPYNQPEMIVLNDSFLYGTIPNIPTLFIGEISGIPKTETFKLLSFIECEDWSESFKTTDKP